jgi:phosphoribosyl-AMP cyclohydrolase
MSNYYTQFSEALVLKGAKQVKWVRTQLNSDMLERLRMHASQHPIPTDKITIPKWAKDIALAEHILNGQDAYFDWEIEKSDSPGKFNLVLYSEENCDLDAVAVFVQAFLKNFAPDHCFTLSWAATTDKLAVGEFGGGGIFITADKVEYVNTHLWLERKARTAGPQANVKV